jgi:hypothetical protein
MFAKLSKFKKSFFYLLNDFADEVVGFVLPLKMMILEHNGRTLVAAVAQATGFINFAYNVGLTKNKLETHLLLCTALNATPSI